MHREESLASHMIKAVAGGCRHELLTWLLKCAGLMAVTAASASCLSARLVPPSSELASDGHASSASRRHRQHATLAVTLLSRRMTLLWRLTWSKAASLCEDRSR